MAGTETAAMDLVGALYESALDPTQWQGTLEALSEFTDSQFVHMFFLRPNEGPAPVFAAVSSGAPDTALSEYHGYWESVDPRRIAGERLEAGILTPDWSLVPPEQFVRSEFYNDFYEPMGLRWLACGNVIKEMSLFACLALTRGVRDEAFSEDECRRVSFLLPHLARAITLHNRFADLQFRAQAGLEALDHVHLGVLLLHSDGRLLFQNKAAAEILRRDDGLTWDSRNGLQAVQHEETRRLQKAFLAAVSLQERRGLFESQVVRVSRASLKRPYAVMFAPASRERGLIRREHGTAAFAVISDPDRRIAPLSEMVAKVHDLTPSESDVVSHLAEGYSLNEIAAMRESSIHTVRWLLKQAMAKTGTRSQADLASLILSSAAALAVARP